MSPAIDLTDLPQAKPETLALAMRLLIEDGRALILMRGATPEDRSNLEERFWQRFDGPTAEGVVALIRLWSLVDVFKAARLRALLLDRGYALLADAARAAAHQRINMTWGFNPQRMLSELAVRRPNLRVITGSMTAGAKTGTADAALAA
ncbi:MAG: hypothetical protein H6876_00075 [Hyphomicrobiaceae bacterium]|nr:hypothetical protein [Hyphomicrobiaceae bacterium]MCC0006513.1 hypothetical protein [Hyphomicrobiaceae bacterium]